MGIVTELAQEFNIKVIRLPYEELSFTLKLDKSDLVTNLLWSFVFIGLRRYGEGLLKFQGIYFCDRVYGLLQSGRMNEDYLQGLVPQIQDNIIEIYSHPAVTFPDEPLNGLPGAGKVELAAWLSDSARELIAKNDFKLTKYNNYFS